jgi:murein L,D-transpeptidase YcbB/YkuD
MEAINTTAAERLAQVVIGLERHRWLNKPLGKRHILVNEAAFMAYVIDNGRTTFETRVVVGLPGRWRTPEFERKMTHLIINPSWYVPESIAGGEYLPMLRKDPDALSRQGIEMYDASGNEVDPTSIDYSAYSKNNFPFSMRQPPSDGNALGIVKFMFPNKHSIYLHDTPAKSLFARDVRAYSHGCVRVADPRELAYTLLGKQSANPKQLFESYVASGVETQLDLAEPVPIYLVYRTVWVEPNGDAQYRLDTYGVDGKVWSALAKSGVKLRGVAG